ncbi:RHS repeat-associated core domain-containing protein [uncultured Actinobacillus sp.]|nr:RHS repeat-associated core domain-containing protein [uncultured Actinobacillus sp.]
MTAKVGRALYYNRFRYYDPESGSYISSDPIGLNGG